jgi:hypothetical protein
MASADIIGGTVPRPGDLSAELAPDRIGRHDVSGPSFLAGLAHGIVLVRRCWFVIERRRVEQLAERIAFIDDEAAQVQRWADALGVDRAEILRDALHRHLVALVGEHDADAWERTPLDPGEQSLSEVADWGPAQDWADWKHAAR